MEVGKLIQTYFMGQAAIFHPHQDDNEYFMGSNALYYS